MLLAGLLTDLASSLFKPFLHLAKPFLHLASASRHVLHQGFRAQRRIFGRSPCEKSACAVMAFREGGCFAPKSNDLEATLIQRPISSCSAHGQRRLEIFNMKVEVTDDLRVTDERRDGAILQRPCALPFSSSHGWLSPSWLSSATLARFHHWLLLATWRPSSRRECPAVAGSGGRRQRGRTAS